MTEWIDDFRRTIDRATGELLAISEEESRVARADGKWSPKEIVGHLIDSASNNHQRFVRSQFTDDLMFLGYEQENWVRVQDYITEPWPQLVALWQNYNLHLAHVMAAIPEEARTKLRRKHNLSAIAWQPVADEEPVTLDYFMRDYVSHLENHLRQILV